MTDETDFLSIDPWPVSELAGHLIAQATLGRRALIETDTESDVFERETDRFELEAWARLELTAWLTPAELDLLATNVGKLTEDQLAGAEQGALIGSTLGWVLHLSGGDRLQAPTDGEAEVAVLAWAPTPWTPVRSLLKPLRVRSDEQLAEERERWEVLAWRTTLFSDQEFIDEDRSAWLEALPEIEAAGLWPVESGDLVLDDGTNLAALSTDELQDLQHDAEVRLRSLNWVCGYGDSPVTAPLEIEDATET